MNIKKLAYKVKEYLEEDLFRAGGIALIIGSILILMFVNFLVETRERRLAKAREIDVKIEESYRHCLESADINYNAELAVSCKIRGFSATHCPPNVVDIVEAGENRKNFIINCQTKKEQKRL
jgi:hypothetical protein